jgi:hypothetical protein
MPVLLPGPGAYAGILNRINRCIFLLNFGLIKQPFGDSHELKQGKPVSGFIIGAGVLSTHPFLKKSISF